MLRILLAIRQDQIEALLSVIQTKTQDIFVISKLNDDILSNMKKEKFHAAVIEDNFDGQGTGWMLAKAIRDHHGQSPVILMLDTSQRYNAYFSDQKLDGLYDWIVSTPFSGEELLSELNFRLLRKSI